MHEPDLQALEAVLARLPVHEPVSVVFDLPELKLAIRRLKPHSARGFDGTSSAELRVIPDGLLLILLDIFQQMSNGFPADLMRARTFPLNKIHGIPCGSQTRPSTVLPQLNRLYGVALSVIRFFVCGLVAYQRPYLAIILYLCTYNHLYSKISFSKTH